MVKVAVCMLITIIVIVKYSISFMHSDEYAGGMTENVLFT
jgi:hypothetical protein